MFYSLSRFSRGLIAISLLGLVLSACSVVEPGTVNDPQEAANRKVHNFNKAFDRNIVSPIAEAYGATVPKRADSAISNFAAHIAIPGEVMNSLLQLNVEDAIINTIRFAVNTVFGLGGTYDFATVAGMEEDVDTDFGETLHVWGFPEGEYVEIPFYGGSTERDAYGLLVDLTVNPLRKIFPGATAKITVPAYVIDKLGDRHQYANVINGILYDSEDSYITSRSIILQNRRFKLNDGVVMNNLEDPYAN